jgi:hypothetical protein
VAAPAKKSATSLTNRVTPIPSNLSITATHAAINKAVIANINNDDADDDNNDAAASDAGEYNYFGDMPNPDPKDISLCDLCGDFILLFAKLKKIAKDYSKDRKVCQSLPLIIPSP